MRLGLTRRPVRGSIHNAPFVAPCVGGTDRQDARADRHANYRAVRNQDRPFAVRAFGGWSEQTGYTNRGRRFLQILGISLIVGNGRGQKRRPFSSCLDATDDAYRKYNRVGHQSDQNWPDRLDPATGLFTYHGDNKTPGSGLHETTRGGNKLLARVFDQIHASPSRRREVPPFFIFTKAPLYGSRAVQFRGLAVPGANGLALTDNLIAVWKSSAGQRFQNYRALFAVLETPRISRAWLGDLRAGRLLSDSCPVHWRQWVDDGSYRPLVAEPSIETRTREEQLPANKLEQEILFSIYSYFRNNPTAFEACAAALVQFQNPESYVIDEITRRSVDGGRDAIGRYRLGPSADPITVDFALEAKCYRPELPGQSGTARQIGVKETARLISRLRHRQFGILVTTSYIGPQAYRDSRGQAPGHSALRSRYCEIANRQRLHFGGGGGSVATTISALMSKPISSTEAQSHESSETCGSQTGKVRAPTTAQRYDSR